MRIDICRKHRALGSFGCKHSIKTVYYIDPLGAIQEKSSTIKKYFITGGKCIDFKLFKV